MLYERVRCQPFVASANTHGAHLHNGVRHSTPMPTWFGVKFQLECVLVCTVLHSTGGAKTFQRAAVYTCVPCAAKSVIHCGQIPHTLLQNTAAHEMPQPCQCCSSITSSSTYEYHHTADNQLNQTSALRSPHRRVPAPLPPSCASAVQSAAIVYCEAKCIRSIYGQHTVLQNTAKDIQPPCRTDCKGSRSC
jgi:hypothetical protein